MRTLCFLLVAVIAQESASQDDEGPYRGKFIGKLNSYHHQVSGEVYAVDEWTLLLVDFSYDGTGDDTFFWAGDTGRPGPQGFIVPDQHGKTNILERYYNEEVRLTLPEGKRLSRIKWFAIYDISTQNAFGDVFVPEELEPPAPLKLSPLSAPPRLSSQPLIILDASTLLIPELKFDGSRSGEEVYWWTGVGPQPSSRGRRLPDEYGYLEPLRSYNGVDVKLSLPADLTVTTVDWVALWDVTSQRALAAVLIPSAPNVPPANTKPHPYKSALPHCRQLHRDYQVAWEVFGNQITVQLAAQISEDEYMAFGISGSAERAQMLGADFAVARYDKLTLRGYATDYNVTAIAPCVSVLGAWRGVCRDSLVGGLDSYQLLSATWEDGVTSVTYRRELQPVESMDLPFLTDTATSVVWAVGALDHSHEPAFHTAFPRRRLALNLTQTPPENDCFPFTVGTRSAPPAWETAELFDPSLRVFHFRVGPSGGPRGLAGRPHRAKASPPLAWYVNGQLAPDLQLRRGLTYTFKVYGGSDPHSAARYHPLVVTADPQGGLERLTPEEQGRLASRVLAGAALTRRGKLTPTAAGGLCVGEHPPGADRRRDADYPSFRAYNRSLTWSCDDVTPALLTVTPNASWPDLVYYNSFTHAGMGGRIFVVDRHNRNIARQLAGAAAAAAPLVLTLVAAAIVAVFTAHHH